MKRKCKIALLVEVSVLFAIFLSALILLAIDPKFETNMPNANRCLIIVSVTNFACMFITLFFLVKEDIKSFINED